MDPVLRRIDELLDDDSLVAGVLEAMRGRFAHSGRRGRYGTPAEVALRMLVLKHLKDWSYEQLQWEVTVVVLDSSADGSGQGRPATHTVITAKV